MAREPEGGKRYKEFRRVSQRGALARLVSAALAQLCEATALEVTTKIQDDPRLWADAQRALNQNPSRTRSSQCAWQTSVKTYLKKYCRDTGKRKPRQVKRGRSCGTRHEVIYMLPSTPVVYKRGYHVI
eukprot:gnl/TRDRNA2_/TRDRNA2_79054_c0_seq1.p1 gnl/TRDRNA2_/TRDRNA2_79054_c0~~gnl/TRDRNA2_/TRDRNA2_79054_c0_seq1.p1  ORF type:complete len:149 (+),score=8.50 gnl/TRDRNA2_/TRDRNA2_79054_c0_seq1:64-447(+)